MYRDVPFRMSPMEWIEEDLREIAEIAPDATTIQLLSANPLALSFEKLEPILKMINRYLPKMEYIYAATRVTDIRNKPAISIIADSGFLTGRYFLLLTSICQNHFDINGLV